LRAAAVIYREHPREWTAAHPQLPAVRLRGATEHVRTGSGKTLMRVARRFAKLLVRENGIASRENFQPRRRRQNQSKSDAAETDEDEAELDEGHLGPRRAGPFSAVA